MLYKLYKAFFCFALIAVICNKYCYGKAAYVVVGQGEHIYVSPLRKNGHFLVSAIKCAIFCRHVTFFVLYFVIISCARVQCMCYYFMCTCAMHV